MIAHDLWHDYFIVSIKECETADALPLFRVILISIILFGSADHIGVDQ